MCQRRPWHRWTPWEEAVLEWSSPLIMAISRGRLGAPEVVSGHERHCTRCLKVEYRAAGH